MRFREPVVVLAAVAGLVLAVLEYFDGGDEFHWRTFVAFLVPIVIGFIQRILVTPVAEPRANDGTPLVKSLTARPLHRGVKLPGDAGQVSSLVVFVLAAIGLIVVFVWAVRSCGSDDVDALRHVVAGLTWR